MKYIRTKDKISGERIYENDIPEPKNKHEKEILQKLRDNIGEVIIKQADTIEELCDEFVVVVKNNPIIPNKNYIIDDYLTAYQGYKTGNTNELYGAIWTDKGLIYVAKMNDKGELKLL